MLIQLLLKGPQRQQSSCTLAALLSNGQQAKVMHHTWREFLKAVIAAVAVSMVVRMLEIFGADDNGFHSNDVAEDLVENPPTPDTPDTPVQGGSAKVLCMKLSVWKTLTMSMSYGWVCVIAVIFGNGVNNF